MPREAGQRDACETARRRGNADARPGQQRRHRGDRNNQAQTEGCQEPPAQHDNFSMSYAPNEMPSRDGGRVIPRELSSGEIEEFLRVQRIARLGCHADGTTYVVPLIYAYEDGAVVAVTTEGRKTAMLREDPRVCVEIDEYDFDGKGSWRSVITYGMYEELSGDTIEDALALLRERFALVEGRAAAHRQLGAS